MTQPGYHIAPIPKGTLGELSKVHEEVCEAIDAQQQGVAVMVLVELSDTIGAIEAYLAQHHPSVTLADLTAMAAVTRRAFAAGQRHDRPTPNGESRGG